VRVVEVSCVSSVEPQEQASLRAMRGTWNIAYVHEVVLAMASVNAIGEMDQAGKAGLVDSLLFLS
jgi:hypothetical protein